MNLESSTGVRRSRGLQLVRLIGALAIGVTPCCSSCPSSPSQSTERSSAVPTPSPSAADKSATARLDAFWSNADDVIHEVQQSLRSARLVASQIGGEAAKGDYYQVISLGHRFGGLGHDHVTPAENAPVIAMLDSMASSIDSLVRLASTPDELAEAGKATDANVKQLSPGAQRLYYLLSAKEKVIGVRSRALELGFRPAP